MTSVTSGCIRTGGEWTANYRAPLDQEKHIESRKSNPRTVMSSTEWCAYFLANARRQREILWELGSGVSALDLDGIAGSLRGWQRGETSDGSHLLAAASDYAEKMRDPTFIEAVQLFIAEEQRHGEMLGRFLELA